MNRTSGRASHLLIVSLLSILLGTAGLAWLLIQSSFFAGDAQRKSTPPVMRTLNEKINAEPVRGNIVIPKIKKAESTPTSGNSLTEKPTEQITSKKSTIKSAANSPSASDQETNTKDSQTSQSDMFVENIPTLEPHETTEADLAESVQQTESKADADNGTPITIADDTIQEITEEAESTLAATPTEPFPTLPTQEETETSSAEKADSSVLADANSAIEATPENQTNELEIAESSATQLTDTADAENNNSQTATTTEPATENTTETFLADTVSETLQQETETNSLPTLATEQTASVTETSRGSLPESTEQTASVTETSGDSLPESSETPPPLTQTMENEQPNSVAVQTTENEAVTTKEPSQNSIEPDLEAIDRALLAQNNDISGTGSQSSQDDTETNSELDSLTTQSDPQTTTETTLISQDGSNLETTNPTSQEEAAEPTSISENEIDLMEPADTQIETPQSDSTTTEIADLSGKSGWIYAGQYKDGKWLRTGLELPATALPNAGQSYTLTWGANVRAAPPGRGDNLAQNVGFLAPGQKIMISTVKDSGRTGHIWLEIKY